MSLKNNLILNTDSYKFSHFSQYPKGASFVTSYIEARGSNVRDVNEVVFFGLQSFIKEWLTKPITRHDVMEAARFCKAHGTPFNTEGWLYIVERHKGFLPVKISALPEGTVVPVGTPMVEITNTDENLPWLTSFLETAILRNVWYGSTVATISRECKKIIYAGLVESADAPDAEIAFKLHDFGFRGVSSFESAGLGGAAHLVNFMGTDTVAGIIHAVDFYNADMEAVGYSIPASEHSTMTMRGRDAEKASYQAMVDAYAKPGAIFAVVSDSYDLFNAIENIWSRGGLFDQVKDAGATVVIRPDSGDPTLIPIQVIEKLMELEGYTINSKGFRVLPNHIRVIQGDGITITSLRTIVERLLAAKISLSNIAFGMGGGLLQQVNRDTFKFAMKACSAVIDGKDVDVYKDPVTDQGKRSKRGVWRPYKNGKGEIILKNMLAAIESDVWLGEARPLYRVVYAAKRPKAEYTFDEVRENARIS